VQFTLMPNQTFNSYDMKVVEGKTPKVVSVNAASKEGGMPGQPGGGAVPGGRGPNAMPARGGIQDPTLRDYMQQREKTSVNSVLGAVEKAIGTIPGGK